MVIRNPAPVEVGSFSHYLCMFFTSNRWWKFPDFWNHHHQQYDSTLGVIPSDSPQMLAVSSCAITMTSWLMSPLRMRLWDAGAASHDQTVASWKRISRLFQGNLGRWNVIIWPDKYPSLGKWSIKVPFPFQRSFSPGQFVMVSIVVFFYQETMNCTGFCDDEVGSERAVKLQMVSGVTGNTNP